MISIVLYKNYESLTFGLVVLCILNSFSTPWPVSLGVAEFAIALLLLKLFYKEFTFFCAESYFFISYFVVFFVLFYSGLLFNDLNDVFRDMVSFLYFGIPYAFFYKLSRSNLDFDISGFYYFLMSFSLLGLVFSLKAMWPFWVASEFDIWQTYETHLMPHTDYVFNDPSVLFSAIFLMSLSLYYCKLNRYFICIFFISLSVISILSPFFAIMRAQSIFYILSLIFMLLFVFKKRIYFLFLFIPFFFYIDFGSIFESIIKKQEVAGSNGKLEEFMYILDYINNKGFYSVFFGLGFGGVYYSPILDAEVRFTHNLFSYSFLKGGVVLLLIVSYFYYFILSKSLVGMIKSYKLNDFFVFSVLLAFLFAFINSTLLQPGYKTLSFALLMIVFVYVVLIKNSISNVGSILSRSI